MELMLPVTVFTSMFTPSSDSNWKALCERLTEAKVVVARSVLSA